MIDVHSETLDAKDDVSFDDLLNALRQPRDNRHGRDNDNGNGNGNGNGGDRRNGGGGDGGGDDSGDIGPLPRILLEALRRSSELHSEFTARAIAVAISGVGETAKTLGEALSCALSQNADLALRVVALEGEVDLLKRQVGAAAGDQP
jgi:hypothetical protein